MDRLTVEVIRNAAIYTSEEMGVVLRRTAYSPNIRDRLDYTCAVLTPDGDLVAQAEHIPVHIGSMSIGVRQVAKWLSDRGVSLAPGDVILTNDPYLSGTHLNDVTVLKPVYHDGEIVAIIANKAHHVDVDGTVPGSIGGPARSLLEEGLVVPPVKIVKAGRVDEEILEILKKNVRTPRFLEGDLRAQLASLTVGERRIRELAVRYGPGRLLDAWNIILDYSERYARSRIRGLRIEGSWKGEDYIELDGGDARIRAELTVRGGSMIVDYTGSSPQVSEPLNAVYGVTVAATVFAIKAVVDPDMPVNQGFFRAVRIVAPEGSIVNPRRGAPVSGGNVETSQRIADVVFRALAQALPGRVPAASCGTMTNVMIGGEGPSGPWAFYETIGCGQGARPGRDGIDGIQTNMTNTLNTPIERLEAEYPVLFQRYGLRPDSEGPGEYRGGLGITRAFTLARGRATLTVMAERCRRRPWGLRGGLPGEPSRHYIVRRDGSVEPLPCKATVTIEEGDTVYINTPGGGGLGNPCKRDPLLVKRDIEEGKITEERARAYYCYTSGVGAPS